MVRGFVVVCGGGGGTMGATVVEGAGGDGILGNGGMEIGFMGGNVASTMGAMGMLTDGITGRAGAADKEVCAN